ncbi:unnamed protein product [Ectocarpus sp. 4 AP-2014]
MTSDAQLQQLQLEIDDVSKQVTKVLINSSAVEAAIAGKGTYRGYSGEDVFLKHNLWAVQKEMLKQLRRRERKLEKQKLQLLQRMEQQPPPTAESTTTSTGGGRPEPVAKVHPIGGAAASASAPDPVAAAHQGGKTKPSGSPTGTAPKRSLAAPSAPASGELTRSHKRKSSLDRWQSVRERPAQTGAVSLAASSAKTVGTSVASAASTSPKATSTDPTVTQVFPTLGLTPASVNTASAPALGAPSGDPADLHMLSPSRPDPGTASGDSVSGADIAVPAAALGDKPPTPMLAQDPPPVVLRSKDGDHASAGGGPALPRATDVQPTALPPAHAPVAPVEDMGPALLDSRAAVAATAATGTAPPMVDATAAPITQSSPSPVPASTMLNKASAGAAAGSKSSTAPLRVSHGRTPPATTTPAVETAPPSSTVASAESDAARNDTSPALPLSHGMLASDESSGIPRKASGREGFTAPPASNAEPQAPHVVQNVSVQGGNSTVLDLTSGAPAAEADPSAGTPAAEAAFPSGPSSDAGTASEEPKTAAAAGIAPASAVTDTCPLACPTSPVLMPSSLGTAKTEATGITLPTQPAAQGSSQACSTSPGTDTKPPRIAAAGAAPTKQGVAPALLAVQGACPVSVSSSGDNASSTVVAASETRVPPTSTVSPASPTAHDPLTRGLVQPSPHDGADSSTSPATPAAASGLTEKTASPLEPATHTGEPVTPAGGAETIAARSQTQAVDAVSPGVTKAATMALSEEPESPLEPGEIRVDWPLAVGLTANSASGGETKRVNTISPSKAVAPTTVSPAGPLSSAEPAQNNTKITVAAAGVETMAAGNQTQAAVATSLATVRGAGTAPSENLRSLPEPAERSAESTLPGGLTESVAPGAESQGAGFMSFGTAAVQATAPRESVSSETAKHVDKIVTSIDRSKRTSAGSQGGAGTTSLDTAGAAAEAPSERPQSPSEPTEGVAESKTTTGLTVSIAPADGSEHADVMSPVTVAAMATALREKTSSRAEPAEHVDQTTEPVREGEFVAADSQAHDASATLLSTTETAATALSKEGPSPPEPAERMAASTSATGLTESVAPADNIPRSDPVSPAMAAVDAIDLGEVKPSRAEPAMHVDHTTAPVGGGAFIAASSQAHDANATSAGAAEAAAMALPKGLPSPPEPAKTKAASTSAADLAESIASDGDIQSADAVSPGSSAASATASSVEMRPSEPSKKCSKTTGAAEGSERIGLHRDTSTKATGTSALAAGSATVSPAGKPSSSAPATTSSQTAAVVAGGKTHADATGTSAVFSTGSPSSSSEPEQSKTSTNKATTAEVGERIAPGDETRHADAISGTAAGSSAAFSAEAPSSSKPPKARAKTTTAAGGVDTIAPRTATNVKTTDASTVSTPTRAATASSGESPSVSESTQKIVKTTTAVEVAANSSSGEQTQPGAVDAGTSASSTDILHPLEPKTKPAKATTGAPVTKNSTPGNETQSPVPTPPSMVEAAAAAAPSEESPSSCEPAKKRAKTTTASGVKAVASGIDASNAVAKAADAGVVTAASSQEMLPPLERVEIGARMAAAGGTDGVLSGSETQTAATTDSQGADATPFSSVSSSSLAGGDQIAQAATGASSQASANVDAGFRRGPGGGKQISMGPTPAFVANASSSVTAKGRGSGGKKKSKRRDFSAPPPPRSKPRRGQAESHGPAHSVEEYLANTEKGTEAVASIKEGTVFWIKFSDTREAWVECAVVTKVYPRSAVPYEVTWRPFDSGGCDLALNAKKRIALTPRLFMSSPANPEPAGENDPPAGTARRGGFQPARKKFKLTVPPIGSWCIVKPDQPWGQLDPFTYE